MNNNPLKNNSSFLEVSVPSSIIVDLETLGLHLKMMFSGQPTEINIFAAGLMRIIEWTKNRTPAEKNSKSDSWTAKYVGFPEIGGTLIFQNPEQELMLSLDASNKVYLGSWRSLSSEEEEHGGIFSIEDSANGRMLVLDTGLTKQNVPLPNSDGLKWGSVTSFLESLQVDDVVQPDELEHTILSDSTQPDNPKEDISSNDAPTILASSARQLNKSMSPPTEISDTKPALTDQPARSKLDVWQCVCGNKNAGPVCLKCGKEKPASASVEMSAPVQKLVCSQCGGVLSKGAKFCRHCGQETGW